MLCRVCLGQRDLAAFAADLTGEQMKALGFPRDWVSRFARYRPPSETTFARLLAPSGQPGTAAGAAALAGPRAGQARSGGRPGLGGRQGVAQQPGAEVVSAYSVQSGRWLGSEPVAKGSNEIPAAQELLRGWIWTARWSPPMRCTLKPRRPASWCRKKAAITSSPSKAIRRGWPTTCDNSTRNLSRAFSPSG